MPHRSLECPFSTEQAIDVIQSIVDKFGYEFVNMHDSLRREDNYHEELHKIKLDSAANVCLKSSKCFRRVELQD